MSSSRTRIPSPARSVPLTPRRRETPRKTRSVCSPARSNASGRLSCIIAEQAIGSFASSPFNRRSVLSDNTDINEPGRKSWWRDLGENSRDVMEVLKENDVEPNNIFENIEVLSQEEKRYTLDLPDSSDSESIQSIVIPQIKLFEQKENQPQKRFNQFGSRETLELKKTNVTDSNRSISTAPKELFQTKPLSRPVFPAALLDISTNTTAGEKTLTAVVETKGHVHNLFNNQQSKNQQTAKRKNMFAKFIASDSEEELPEIQPKFFALQKKPCTGRPSLSSRGFDASITSEMDAELDDWQFLPSSTMVDHQLNITLNTGLKPKKSRLSKLSEAETATNSSDTSKTKQPNNRISSKNKSTIQEKSPQPNASIVTRNSSKTNNIILSDAEEEINKSQNKSQTSLNTSHSSIVTRSKNKSDIAKSQNASMNRSKNFNTSKNISKTSTNIIDADENAVNKSVSKRPVAENQNINTENKGLENELRELADDEAEEHFTLKYEDDNANEVDEAHETKNRNDKSNKEVNASKNIAQKSVDSKVNSTTNVSTTDEHSPKAINKVIEESAEMSDHNKSHISTQKINEDVINDENTNTNKIVDQAEVVEGTAPNKSQKLPDESQMKNNDGNNQSKQNSHEIKHGNDHDDNEDKQNESQEERNENKEMQNENQEDHNESHKKPSESQEDQNMQNESQDDQSESQEECNESQEIQDESQEIQNDSEEVESEVENIESHEETEDQNDTEEEENESEAENNESYGEIEDQNDTEEQEIESQADNNESHKEIEDEQNASQEEIEQNESVVDDSEMECEEANESIAVSDQDDNQENYMECEDANESIEAAAESDQNDNQEIESDHEDQIEGTETPNVSHDTTGRNRKKSLTPEAILRDSRTEADLTKVVGRNTSIRKTKSLVQHPNIRRSLEPARESMEFSDGTKNSSAEGSGWDSHRTTRKTLRQTFGKDFTPRKSLRALVMEKSAKERATVKATSVAKPIANSTALLEPEISTNEVPQINDYEMDNDHNVHEVSIRTRQATIVECLERAKKNWAEIDTKAENIVKRRLEQGRKGIEDPFKVPARPTFQRPTSQPKPKAKKPLQSFIPLESLPEEFVQDLKYKPPKRFAPRNAPWLTKRLYKYLETKLEPKYSYKARIRAEKFAQMLHEFVQSARRRGAPDVASPRAVDHLKREMARLNFVKTHFDFYNFFHDFMPREVRIKVIPDIVNKIPHPRNGVFSDIL